MRILITGSSGQVGTNLALRALAAGHRVVGLDRRANPWTRAFPTRRVDLGGHGGASGQRPARAGLLDWTPPGFAPDVVVHLAAHAKVHALVLQPALAMENVASTAAVLEYCRVRATPLVFASSREVYGDTDRPSTREEDVDVARVASPYAASKIAGEAMVRAYARSYGLRHLVVRLSNVYGRYDNDLARMERVVPLFVARIGAGQPVTVYGADKVLDFTHVDDCVAGLLAGLERLVAGTVRDETVNLATGTGHSLLDLAAEIGEALGRPPRIVLAPRRPGEITRYVADLSRARRLLDYAPRFGLREGLREAIAWGAAWRGLPPPSVATVAAPAAEVPGPYADSGRGSDH
jgi:UDP-glucose 4-epimerase